MIENILKPKSLKEIEDECSKMNVYEFIYKFRDTDILKLKFKIPLKRKIIYMLIRKYRSFFLKIYLPIFISYLMFSILTLKKLNLFDEQTVHILICFRFIMFYLMQTCVLITIISMYYNHKYQKYLIDIF